MIEFVYHEALCVSMNVQYTVCISVLCYAYFLMLNVYTEISNLCLRLHLHICFHVCLQVMLVCTSLLICMSPDILVCLFVCVCVSLFVCGSILLLSKKQT